MSNELHIDPALFRRRGEWNEAAGRLRLYIKKIGITDELSLTTLETRILLRAALLYDEGGDNQSPVEVTLHQAQEMMTEWFAQGKFSAENGSTLPIYEGITRLQYSGIMQESPDHFISAPPDSVTIQILKRNLIQACPELSISNMTARPVDYGPLAPTPRNSKNEWAPIFAALAFWSLIYIIGYNLLV